MFIDVVSAGMTGDLCAVSFLMALINEMMQKNDRQQSHWLWFAPVIYAVVAILGYVIL